MNSKKRKVLHRKNEKFSEKIEAQNNIRKGVKIADVINVSIGCGQKTFDKSFINCEIS